MGRLQVSEKQIDAEHDEEASEKRQYCQKCHHRAVCQITLLRAIQEFAVQTFPVGALSLRPPAVPCSEVEPPKPKNFPLQTAFHRRQFADIRRGPARRSRRPPFRSTL